MRAAAMRNRGHGLLSLPRTPCKAKGPPLGLGGGCPVSPLLPVGRSRGQDRENR